MTSADQGQRPGGPSAVYRDPAQRAELYALLDDGFPTLSERIERAAMAGFAWDAVTEPFVARDQQGLVAHVGILEHAVRLMGQDVLVAGMHAVVTHSRARGKGWSRRAQREALSWVDERYRLCKLSTDDPPVYESQGFRKVQTHRFHLDHSGGKGRGRPLDPSERGAFVRLCREREPVSDVFASRDPGWLVGIDLTLMGRDLSDLTVLADLDCVVSWRIVEGTLVVEDLFARRLPQLAAVLDAAPPHDRAELCFTPDKLAPQAHAIPEAVSTLMVRGAWPIPETVAFAVPPLAEH